MKTVLAFIGGYVVILGILGAFGFGDFVLMYSSDRITCVKEIRHDSN